MKILIVGAKGMLGSVLASTFSDFETVCTDKKDVDITNISNVRNKVVEVQPNIIINAAAYTDVDAAESHRDEAFKVNEEGTRNIATVAKETDATVIHFSTDYVFPGDKEEGYSENDSPGPAVNSYGESKLAGERALKEVHPKFYLIRTAWLYGPNGKNFVHTMLALAGRNEILQVVDDQIGNPTYTKDVAVFTKTLIVKEYYPGIYHAVNSGSASWFEFASKIFQITHKKVNVKPISSSEYRLPAKRPKFSILKNTQGPSMRSWDAALDEYLRSL